jgi:predicted nucleotidyltransferase
MIKYNKLPDNIHALIPAGVSLLRETEPVAFAYLFGGLARGKAQPLSDVDIAVYLLKDENVTETKMDLLGKLVHVLETDEIDLVILNTAPLPLRMKILEQKKVIVDHVPFLRHLYESLTMREYFDFSMREMAILERRFMGG